MSNYYHPTRITRCKLVCCSLHDLVADGMPVDGKASSSGRPPSPGTQGGAAGRAGLSILEP